MINLPRLDDQLYIEILNNARRKIPRLIPEWTDFNPSDPGVTLLELLAWLKEMQQYHLDRVTDINRVKFLKLLGCKPLEVCPSSTNIMMNGSHSCFPLPKGSRFACGDIIFESSKKTWVHDYRIDSIMVYDGSHHVDQSNSLGEYDISFYAFGEDPKPGNAIYFGSASPFTPGQRYDFWFEIFDDYPVRRNPKPHGAKQDLSVLRWETYRNDTWVPISDLDDGTDGFLRNGSFEFQLEEENQKCIIPGYDKERYWIRARLVKASCEESPKIRNIYTCYGPVRQHRTITEVHQLKSEVGNQVTLDTWLSLHGDIELQMGSPEKGWVVTPEDVTDIIHVQRDDKNASCHIRINGMGPGGDGPDYYRVVFIDPDFTLMRTIGSSDGLPHQKFRVHQYGNILREGFTIQVAEKDKQGTLRWHDWSCDGELHARRNTDRCFGLDYEEGILFFGDNENGLTPPAGQDNIRILTCKTSEGSRGNVNRGSIDRMPSLEFIAKSEIENLVVENMEDCTGGEDEESIQQAINRLKQGLKIPSRAVTVEDFEYLTASTPGYRIALAKAIPASLSEGSIVRVAVLPFSYKQKPQPDKAYITGIRNHLEKFRLVGTMIEVVPPQYIEISIYAEVVPANPSDDLEERILNQLNDYLSTIGKIGGGNGRSFGDPIFESDIISMINTINGVSYVKRVFISAHGNGWSKSKGGDIHIPYNALLMPGQHEINIKDY